MKEIIIIILSGIFAYFIMSFIAFEMNIYKWEIDERVCFIMIFACIGMSTLIHNKKMM